MKPDNPANPDWASLTHAYGPATDAPEMLRAIANGTDEEREAAFEDFWGSYIHQGTYSAAAVAIAPLLVEIALEPTAKQAADLLDMVQFVARGWPEFLDRQRDRRLFFSRTIMLRRAFPSDELFVRGAYDAILAYCDPLIHRMGSDSNVDVRFSCALVLSCFVTERQKVILALMEALDHDPESRSRTGLILALYDLTQGVDESCWRDAVCRRMRTLIDDEPSVEERLAAGIVLLGMCDLDMVDPILAFAAATMVTEPDTLAFRSWAHSWSLFHTHRSALEHMQDKQLAWIVSGLAHRDPGIVSEAIVGAETYCERYRSGPATIVPHLVNLTHAKTSSYYPSALNALSSIGQVGLDVIQRFADEPLAPQREDAIKCLESYRESWEFYQQQYREPSPDLGAIEGTESLVETIERYRGSGRFDDCRKVVEALTGLGFLGERSKEQVELVRSLCEHSHRHVQIAAVRAYWRITNDSAGVVAMVDALWVADVSAIPLLELLGQCGPAATTCLPTLRALVAADRRCVQYGWIRGNCHLDETILAAAANAIEAIE